MHKGPEMLTTEIISREVAFAWDSLQTVTLNESAWNYLRGLAKFHKDEACADVIVKYVYTIVLYSVIFLSLSLSLILLLLFFFI